MKKLFFRLLFWTLKAMGVAGIVALIIAVFIGIPIFYFTMKSPEHIVVMEYRYAMWIGMFLFASLVFIMLLMRNALVANTLYLIKLRDMTAKHSVEVKNNTKELKTSNSELGNLKKALDRLDDTMGQQIRQYEKEVLKDSINKANSGEK